METKMSAMHIRQFVIEQLSRLGIVDPTDEDIERLSKKLARALSGEECANNSPSILVLKSPNSAVYKTYPMSQRHSGSPVTLVTPSPVPRTVTRPHSCPSSDVSDTSMLSTPSLMTPSTTLEGSSLRKRKVCRMNTSQHLHSAETSAVSGTSQDENQHPLTGGYVDYKTSSTAKSFIRPQTSQRLKCDPVNRYHRYKEHWDSCPVPGDSVHKELRWRVREKMLAVQKDDLVVAGAREPVKVNNYVVPTSKKRQELRWEIRTSMAHKEELVL